MKQSSWSTMGTQLNVESTGSEDFAAFDVTTTMPALPELEDSNTLRTSSASCGNETDVVPDLRWSEDEDLNTELKLYVGASKLVLERVSFYQAIVSTSCWVTLADDGQFSLPDEFVGVGLSGSSMWAYLRRQPRSDSFSDPMHSTLSRQSELRRAKVAGRRSVTRRRFRSLPKPQ